jgi:P-type Ca2+ transporter type 2C
MAMILEAEGRKESAREDWHRMPPGSVLSKLRTSKDGLSRAEAQNRLTEFGANEIHEGRQVKPWVIFVRQFKSLLILLLVAAAVVSGVLGEWVDSLVIAAIVVLNAIIGFYQEFSAEKSIAALKRMSAPRATVRREGKHVSIPAAQVVPGDILLLEPGDLIAADARLTEANVLRSMESALTGESEAVDKHIEPIAEEKVPLGDRKNMVFMGTHVVAGTGLAMVVAIGMSTELGHIAKMITQAGAGETTPLQEKLHRFGRVLVWISLAIVGLLFGIGLWRGMSFVELLMTSIGLAVATVPEGLPAVVTIALALGVMRMAKRRALVRRLPAVETLGATNVICSDKTGTLTVGEMTVRELFVAGESFSVTGEGYGPEGEVLRGGGPVTPAQAAHLLELADVMIGSNNASLTIEESRWKVVGDPTEGALLAAGHKAGGNKERIERDRPRRHEIPFDSERKRRTVIRLSPDGRFRAFVNGAPDVLLEHCTQIYTSSGVQSLMPSDREAILKNNNIMADRGLRVLGSAYRDITKDATETLTADAVENCLVFVGLAGMYDPPRAEAKAAVAECHEAGIRVVMITGDHGHTARAIAAELGIATDKDETMSGTELETLTENELKARVPQVTVYARVSAEHKLRIVRAWKSHGAVVAMTGDGVNDAPALKGADIGIAMGRSGTEVTKQAADMVVTDDNFASIVAAVEEGRGIFDNIRKTLQYLLASNAGELFVMAAALVLGLPLPLLPLHLLWINLITDGPPALALAADPIEGDVMRRPPRPASDSISGASFWGIVVLTGMLTGGVALAIYHYHLRTSSLELARTYTFATLVFSQLFLALTFRSETKPIWRMSMLSNRKLMATLLISLGLQTAIFRSEPLASLLKCLVLPWSDLALLVAACLLPSLVIEARKGWRQRTLYASGKLAHA